MVQRYVLFWFLFLSMFSVCSIPPFVFDDSCKTQYVFNECYSKMYLHIFFWFTCAQLSYINIKQELKEELCCVGLDWVCRVWLLSLVKLLLLLYSSKLIQTNFWRVLFFFLHSFLTIAIRGWTSLRWIS